MTMFFSILSLPSGTLSDPETCFILFPGLLPHPRALILHLVPQPAFLRDGKLPREVAEPIQGHPLLPVPPAAAGRRLCRCGSRGPFRRISRGPYIHRRPCSSAPAFSYPIPFIAACWGGAFLSPHCGSSDGGCQAHAAGCPPTEFLNLQKVHRIFDHFCL